MSLLDLNLVERPPWFDRDELARGLAARAEEWVPRYFPKGRIEGGELRLADITGRPPRKMGSCVIQLRGEYAGTFHDWSTGDHGGPLRILSEATRLNGVELFDLAAREAGLVNGKHAPPAWAKRPPAPKRDPGPEIAFTLQHCTPAAGTLVETYFRARGLEPPDCADLLFHPNLTDYGENIGRPAMVAVIRRPDGTPTGGIHRTYLREDGSGKAEMPKPKKMLGPIGGGALHLAPIGDDGVLGVTEGIENARAAMLLFAVPCWPLLSTSGFSPSDEENLFVPPAACRRLIIFADAGKAGEDAAAAYARRVKERRPDVDVEIRAPRGGDDFADDLVRGLWAAAEPPGPAQQEVIPPAAQRGFQELLDDALALQRDFEPAAVTALLREALAARFEPMSELRILDAVRTKTKIRAADMDAIVRQVRRDLGMAVKTAGAKRPAWFGKMLFHENGMAMPVEANITTVLREDPELRGVVAYDEFSLDVILRARPPWENARDFERGRRWSENDDNLLLEWLQRRELYVRAEGVRRAVVMVARENPVHPVRDYLSSLEWDGQPRLDTWLSYYLGVEDSGYARAVGARWMISAVARAFRPGCKADCMLILHGEQGIKKSSALRTLGGAWFIDRVSDIGSKDAMVELLGTWIVEFSELDSLIRAEVSRLKAFLTNSADRFRPPYGAHVIDNPRQCVFAGSVNEDEVLKDPTGARRFWIVHCEAIDLVALKADRDQLWAEARVRFDNGEKWWIDRDEYGLWKAAEAVQQDHYQDDPWTDLILSYVENRTTITHDEILREVLKMEPAKWGEAEKKRVGRCLRANGWKRQTVRVGQRTKKGYQRVTGHTVHMGSQDNE